MPEDRFVRRYGLTRREMEVMKYIGQAFSNKDIAEQLFISDQTVSVHRKNIMRKIGVKSTANLIRIAYENNLV
jgi:DNA-binding NarL/FixJ family response regulator